MDEGAGLWYNLAQPPSVGLAAPVDRLLQQLAKQPPIQQNLYGDSAIDEELA
jgi:A/G-specific adenine glycosylase